MDGDQSGGDEFVDICVPKVDKAVEIAGGGRLSSIGRGSPQGYGKVLREASDLG